MTSLLSRVFLCLLLLFSQAGQKVVPVGDEPRHRTVFSNQYVRVIDATVAPGDTTLFHTHTEDNVPVAISGSRMRTEILDGKTSESTVESGNIWFAKGAYTHRITNIGQTTLRFIDAEVLATPGTAASIPVLDKVPGLTMEIDNERVRVYRVKLGPGQSTGLYSHATAGLTVAITAGRIAVASSDGSQRVTDIRPGEFSWRGGAEAHSIQNLGDSLYEAVEIEWK